MALIIVAGCIEPFTPDNLEHNPKLFIQGIISDSPAVKDGVLIANTFPLSGKSESKPLHINTSGALVYVKRNDGMEFYFAESESSTGLSAVYTPVSPIPELQAGSSYQLIIVTTEGYRFESDYELYTPSPEIESITVRVVEAKTTEMADIQKGYNFYISTREDGTGNGYFRWEMDYTYMFSVPFRADYIWTGSERIAGPGDDYRYCFMDGKVPGIFIASSDGLKENRVINAPLHFVPQYGNFLQHRYSLRTFQFRITPSAFSFWYNLRKTISETGGLYETQPFRITGNILCVSGENIDVTGIFEVAGVSEKRIFVPRPFEFPVYEDRCVNMPVGGSFGIQWIDLTIGSYLMFTESEGLTTASKECFDCRLKGGYLDPPPFWKYFK